MLSQRESFLYKGGGSISQVFIPKRIPRLDSVPFFFGGDGIILQNSLMKGVEKSFMHIICSRYSRWSGGQLLQVRIPLFPRQVSSSS